MPERALADEAEATLQQWRFEAMRLEGGPSARWGAGGAVASGSFYVFGGMDEHGTPLADAYSLCLGEKGATWSKMRAPMAHARAWHGSCAFQNSQGEDWLLGFGGQVLESQDADELRYTSNLECLDLGAKVWFEPHVTGKPPTPRGGHTMVATTGHTVLVFGGCHDTRWLNDVVVLDTDRWAWSHPHTTGVAPLGCSYHTAKVVGENMFVLGGNDDGQCFNKLHVLSLLSWDWSTPALTGPNPAPRTGHCAEFIDDDHMLVYGGWDPDGAEQDDSDGATFFKDGALLNTATGVWAQLDWGKSFPKEGLAGSGQSSALAKVGSELVVFGGRSGEAFSDTIWRLRKLNTTVNREAGK